MPRRDTDRNLLFGILALQMDFITRDALVAGMNAWVLEKQRPLGEILVERKALDPNDRAAIDPMVDRHIARHNNDPAASLAAVSSIESLAKELHRKVDDPEVQQSIAQIPTDSQLDPHATRAPETADYLPPGVRYHKVRDHAEGGLGIVFVARDNELNREVALKEIKSKYADNPSSQARFLIEAEITGGLEHPGIVPVYGLGHYGDGRPYYAMRFIRGDSLKDAIKTFHHDPTLKKDPGARTLALQKLLRRFLDVCNAIAYAHSRGVLHRDLKPDNVMVGKYGETLVVDWGLAKSVGRSGGDNYGPMPESTVMYPAKSGSADTVQGQVVGTPSYMSPEQAEGRLDLLGPASDVYSLGATLYSLLTARVPITGENHSEVLQKVIRGEIPRPREAAPWLDPALEAICLQAMALKAADRYPSPRALAEDVERWLADEPVTAYREPFTRRTRRWAKKHRTALTGVAAATMIAALSLGGFAWLKYDQRRKTDASALPLINKADGLAIEARIKGEVPLWDKAINEARLAEDRLESGNGSPNLRREVASRLADFRAQQARRVATLEAEKRDSRMVKALEEARLLTTKDFDLRSRLDAYLAAFQTYGIDIASLPVEEAARRIRSSSIADELIATLDDWSRYQDVGKIPPSRLDEIARAAETDPLRASIRDAVSRKDPAALRRLCELPEDRRKLGPRLRTVFTALRLLDPESSFTLLESIRQEYPAYFWFNENLGTAYCNTKPARLDDAIRCYSIAVALKPDSPGARVNLGNALHDQGKLEQAIEEYRQAIRINPDLAEPHHGLGIALRDQGKIEQAIEKYRQAIRIKPDYADAHYNLGNTLRDQGKLEQAVEEYRQAIRIKPDDAKAYVNLGLALRDQDKLEQAIEQYQLAIRIKPDLAEPHYNLGVVFHNQGKVEQAIEEYKQATRIKPDYAVAYNNLGYALSNQGKLEQAIEQYQQAIRIKPDFTIAHVNLGNALSNQGKLEQAIEEYKQATRIKPDYADAHYNLGIALHGQGKLEQAIEQYQQAIRIKPDHVDAHMLLGNALRDQGNIEQAIEEHKQVIRIKPDHVDAHMIIAYALYGQGKLEQAIEQYQQAIRINPDYADAHNNLGIALHGQGKLEQAIEQYQQAIRINPDYADAHYNLGNALRDQGKPERAIEEYREAIRIKPDFALAHCVLGLALQSKGLFQEALKSLERGHELGSKQPDWRYPSEAMIVTARGLVELEAKVLAILRGEATPKDAAERLALADICYKTGRYATAVRFSDEAFTEKPALAEEVAKIFRYLAACSASLASSGQSKDDPAPDEATRVQLREKALGWLKADLAAWSKTLDGTSDPARKQEIVGTLDHWKEDSDLAGLRDEAALAKLPESERVGFQELWRDVETLRKKAGGK